MIKFLAMIVAACFFAFDADAAVFKMEFEATGLGNFAGTPAGISRSARGSVTWEAAAASGDIDRLIDFELEFGGKRFGLGDVGFSAFGDSLVLYGHHEGSTLEGNGVADDFIIAVDRALQHVWTFQISIDGMPGVWANIEPWGYDGTVAARFASSESADVSEPGTLTVALVGFAALALAMRRRVVSPLQTA